MVELRLTQVLSEPSGLRWDSEFFRKPILAAKASIEGKPHDSLGNLTPRIQHPVEIERTYSEAGLRILLAQEVRDNQLVLGEGSFMPPSVRPLIAANRLERDDVLLTRSGANFGQCAPMKTDDEIFACADLLIVRKGRLPGGYLSTLLNTRQGRLLLDRGAYGMAQPHIAPTYVRTLPVPLFEELAKIVDRTVEDAESEKSLAISHLTQAEQTFLKELGLADWAPPEALTWHRRAKDVLTAARWDAEYFAPRVQQLIKKLSAPGVTVGSVAPLRKKYFTPVSGKPFDYIEISNVTQYGEANSTRLDGGEAPSRATWHVRKGDIITSTVRPIRRLTALIQPEQDNFVCSSGFAVLQPKTVPSELLLVYLRLPVICELMDLHTTASMYPAISVPNILALPFVKPSDKGREKIVSQVQSARAARRRAHELLERAKRAVEIAIEDSEAAALKYLKGS